MIVTLRLAFSLQVSFAVYIYDLKALNYNSLRYVTLNVL